ncbi:hypothetical protein P154DRAFT_428054 [Amniculicola lignicola CBS 123094]|uniref:Uncharacterized protein n=1 Tax=Amniculicola lignicola CBS 123094 TaxID=1392246 RepID=A0A6A5WXS0_9PLEO|nr:hypothetical protein P154DRAFT_428054 [Amniculicola lignicola CBS 123094]
MPKPPAELTIPKASEEVTPGPQDTVLQTPVTPVTPVTTEGLRSLQNLIINRDAHTLNERSKYQIRFLMKINDEAKVRRSTRAVVLGTAKVMSY